MYLEDSETRTVTITGSSAVPTIVWRNIPAQGVKTAVVKIVAGTYTIRAQQPFGAFLYGGRTDASYGFPAGLLLADTNVSAQNTRNRLG